MICPCAAHVAWGASDDDGCVALHIRMWGVGRPKGNNWWAQGVSNEEVASTQDASDLTISRACFGRTRFLGPTTSPSHSHPPIHHLVTIAGYRATCGLWSHDHDIVWGCLRLHAHGGMGCSACNIMIVGYWVALARILTSLIATLHAILPCRTWTVSWLAIIGWLFNT